MNTRVRDLCRCALFSAIICICSMITIPTAPVPINLAFFALLLTAFLLPSVHAVVSTAVYILLGLAGLPVFAGMQGGLGVMAGPTGGFIIGYLPMVIAISAIKGDGKKPLRNYAAIITGYSVCYLIGIIWLTFVTGSGSLNASLLTILPFVPADIFKAVAAFIVIRRIKGRL